jgi:type VI secretion system secreted protein Hcp
MAAVDMFLKIDGIQGESQDKTHKNEIEILSVSFGVSNAGSGAYGMGSGTAKAAVSDAHIMKHVDKSTPSLWKYCFQGKTVGDADITVRKAGGDSPVEYLKYKLSEVFVSSVQDSGSDGAGVATESLSLNFAKVEITYTVQNADGSAGASTPVTLDIKQNAAS